jgi:hypothetical protein
MKAPVQNGHICINFISAQVDRAEAAFPGQLSGYEIELPVTYAAELSAVEAIQLESRMTRDLIALWNHHLGSEPAIQQHPDKSQFMLRAEKIHVSPQQIEEILATYASILDQPATDGGKTADFLPEIARGYTLMQEFRGMGLTHTVAEGGIVHPDNHRLTEFAMWPFQSAFDPVSVAVANVATKTIEDINNRYEGVLQMHPCAVADHGLYTDVKKRAFPGAELPIHPLLAARHLILTNPMFSNGSMGMSHGGLHVTAGIGDPKRLNDVLRALVGITPALMVLTENNGSHPQFALRLLHGSWLGQNPKNKRMGAVFFNPALSTEKVIEQIWQSIFDSPMIVDLRLKEEKFIPIPLSKENVGKPVRDYLNELYSQFEDQNNIDWDSAIRQQSKTWGLYRVREIGEGSEILVEYRPLDTQSPLNALPIQAIIQGIAQNPVILDSLLDHFEAAGLVPSRGQDYTAEQLEQFESDLRETALRALTGRDASYTVLSQKGLAMPYAASSNYTIGDTAQVLLETCENAGLNSAVTDYLRDRIDAHLHKAVAEMTYHSAQCRA